MKMVASDAVAIPMAAELYSARPPFTAMSARPVRGSGTQR